MGVVRGMNPWFWRDANALGCHDYMKPLKGGSLSVAKPQGHKGEIFFLSLSFYKKGDPSLPTNYRPITVGSVLYRIFAKILHNRLSKLLTLSPNQAIFIPELQT